MGRRKGPSDESRRDKIWGEESASLVFPTRQGGWAPVPRTVPMIASLINEIGGRENAGGLYQVLWGHSRAGHVDTDPVLFALEAGYVGSEARATKRFNERARILENLGFIIATSVGAREFARVLLLDPHPVVARLFLARSQEFLPGWKERYEDVCRAAGIASDGLVAATAC